MDTSNTGFTIHDTDSAPDDAQQAPQAAKESSTNQGASTAPSMPPAAMMAVVVWAM